MPLLTPPDILPEAMRFLVRALLSVRSEVAREELIDLIAPSGLVEAMKSLGAGLDSPTDGESDLKTGGAVIADKSLLALGTLGIVQASGRNIRLAAIPDDWLKPTDVDARSFAAHLRKRIFASVSLDATIGDSGGVMDLAHGLAALHVADNPLWPFTSFETDKTGKGRAFMDYQHSLFGNDRSNWPVPNKEQWLPFRRWATYLGLASPTHKGLLPDCSVALTQELNDLPAGNYEIEQFTAECSRRIPTLDGGLLHFSDLTPESTHTPALSPGLSISLIQLEAEGLVTLSKLSDIGTRTLRIGPGTGSSVERPVSHVKWAGASSRRTEK